MRPERLRALRWALWLAALLALPVAWWARARQHPAPPVLATLGSFALTDEQDRPFTRETLRGRVWIANFIFTSCPSSCPRLTRYMARVQDRTRPLGDRVRLVSFSVDPAVDTPAVLRAYGQRYGADPARWSFVTGEADAMQRTVTEGFRVMMERAAPPGPARARPTGIFDIAHGNQLVLVDARGRIRGYHHADDEGLDPLADAARALVAESESEGAR